MTRKVKTVSRDITMGELNNLFASDDFNAYPVIDQMQVVGLVTKFDFLKCFALTLSSMVPRYDELMYLGGEIKLAACRRPHRDYEEDCGDYEVDAPENSRGQDRAPDLHQSEIGCQFQHEQAERGNQRRQGPHPHSDQQMTHPDIGNNPVGTPKDAQVLDDIL